MAEIERERRKLVLCQYFAIKMGILSSLLIMPMTCNCILKKVFSTVRVLKESLTIFKNHCKNKHVIF